MRLPTPLMFAVLAACAAAPVQKPPTDVAAVASAIDSLDSGMQRWFVQENVDSIVGYYTSDAIVMSPNQPVARGSDAIRAAHADLFKQLGLRLVFKRESLVVADSIASDQGHYTMELRAKPDTTKVVMSDHGSYVTTFVYRGGRWRALYDIATSEVPLPPPAAPVAKSGAKR